MQGRQEPAILVIVPGPIQDAIFLNSMIRWTAISLPTSLGPFPVVWASSRSLWVGMA
jgi:hypothetical protein